MCFSASASFTAGWFLICIGIAALIKVKKTSQTMFAAIPLLFAAQQSIEGLLWLSFDSPSLAPYTGLFTYGFLFFAFILWPTWMPCSLWVLEPNLRKKRSLFVMTIIGMITSALLLAWLVYAGASASVAACYIWYQVGASNLLFNLGMFLYISATIVPFFISSMKYTRYVGLALAVSYMISYYFYYQVLVSVWCFFAALLSVGILIM